MGVDEATFRRVMGAVPTGVAIFTLVDRAGADHGMTVGAFCSLSLAPPLVLACIGDDATIAAVTADAERFGMSILADDQAGVSQRFADRDARGFAGIPHSRSPGGVILLDGAVTQFECRITGRHRGGDHTIVVGEMTWAKAMTGSPLVHHRGEYRRLDPERG